MYKLLEFYSKEKKIGEKVWDDLTNQEVIIVEIFKEPNKVEGYRVNNNWLDGLRHGWEISPIPTK